MVLFTCLGSWGLLSNNQRGQKASFKSYKDYLEWKEHDKDIQRHFPLLTQEQRIIIYVHYFLEIPHYKKLSVLGIKSKRYYKVVNEFKAYDIRILPVDVEMI